MPSSGFCPYSLASVTPAACSVSTLHARGVEGAYLYGAADPPERQLAGGLGAFFLLTEKPERYGLPANAAATPAASTPAASAVWRHMRDRSRVVTTGSGGRP